MGHPHEDIDKTYRLSKKIIQNDMFSLLEMMNSYRTCEDYNSYVPYLIDEIFYIKSFVEQHLFNGNTKIEGIKKFPYFRFLMIDNISILQYKVSHRDQRLLTYIHLWCSLLDGSVDLLLERPDLLSL